ncbi:MAG: hypothetical protein ACKVS9_03670 [Phycisphaerae bacterium]
MSVAEDAIKWLRELPSRCQLASSLGVPQGTVMCYYAAAFKNTLGILKDGLRCKNDPSRPAGVDLSTRSIQVRRRTAWLGREGTGREYDVHDCLNLLLNPLSETRQAFEKNSLIARSQDQDAWPLCVLEYDLSALFGSPDIRWGIAHKNIAKGARPAYTAATLLEQPFNWDIIFSSPERQSTIHDAKGFRAAEVLLHLGSSSRSAPLSNSFLRRVLVRQSDLSELQVATLKSAVTGSTTIAHVPALDPDVRHLLHDDLCLVTSPLRPSVAKACRDAVLLEESERISPALRNFRRKENKENWKHGQGHIVRVMVWSAYLSRATRLNAAERHAAMIAAAIHDLDRLTDNTDEPEHGRLAADRHRPQVLRWVWDDRLAESCLEAVRLHCLDDSEAQNKDSLWSTLKDADALDRGRFGTPVDPGNQGKGWGKGCECSQLRNKSAAQVAAWDAYRLARVTAYVNWDKDRPVRSLCDYLTTACREVIKLGVPDEVAAANRFLEALNRDGGQ